MAVGLGWAMLQRASRQVIAAASWALLEGVEGGADDINRWELRAALAGLGALVFLRSGRVDEVWQGAGVMGSVMSAVERRRLNSLVALQV